MTFYATDVSSFMPALHTWLEHMVTFFPPGITLTPIGEGDIIEDTTGELVSGWANAPGSPVVGSGTSPYSAPVGALVKWLTSDVVDGHRLKGHTFIVPVSLDQFSDYGNIKPVALGYLQTYCDDFVGDVGENMLIWHRPRKASVKHPVARLGTSKFVTSAAVPAKAAVLTSRRD
jgi:hypothetical protein